LVLLSGTFSTIKHHIALLTIILLSIT